MNDAEADKLIAASVPVYYITGAIHSPETGSPSALMELVYRLAVDESPYIRKIRDKLVVLITPIVEVDGRDRHVDIYNWHLANPGKQWPPTLYWGKYVAHDNNRDAMAITLKLTENVLNTFLGWKAQVLHDLHESVPYLYDNTIGDGPYNAWLDPILTDEWQMIGWHNVSELTKMGMPGVFTHGTFDTWTPGYLMFLAATHNGISRLYETFGNAGADTVERTIPPSAYSRTWYRQNPPFPKTLWSQRNNNNYQQTGLLVSLNHFADNSRLFLKNFYLKSKRSIQKARTEGPAGYVFSADDPRLGAQADLLRVLQKQAVEISRATAPFTVTTGRKRRPQRETTESGDTGTNGSQESNGAQKAEEKSTDVPEVRTFPAGSYVIRMDQPYSRIADALLDYQYWAPDDPQRNPYDDTGWTFGELFNVKVTRVPDVKVLDATMERVTGSVTAPGGVKGSGLIFVLNHNTDPSLMTLRYRFKDAAFDVAEEPFEIAGQSFKRGSFIVRSVDAAAFDGALKELGLQAAAVAEAPSVKTHPARAARTAILHTWLNTQDEGWWRLTFDQLKIPFTYISTQDVAKDPALRSKYDVILFPPVGRGAAQAIVSGMPMFGNAMPWKTSQLTPNIGKIDSTDDIRPGLGWEGMAHLQRFITEGGVLVTVDDTADFSVTYGLTHGVNTTRPQRLKVTGSVLRSKMVDETSPIAYGYDDGLSIYAFDGPVFGLSNLVRGGARPGGSDERRRPTGRGTADDPDQPQGRPGAEAPDEPRAEPWQAMPVTAEQLRNGINVIPPADRPRVVLRYGDSRDLLVSGLLDGGSEIAQRPMVIDVPVGKGHVILFSNNPVWRGETRGSYFLVFNTILNHDHLGAGRTLDKQ